MLGKTLDFGCRDPEDPHKASDELLRCHFRQSVLGNMRGAGICVVRENQCLNMIFLQGV